MIAASSRPSGSFAPVLIQDRVGEHMQADVANEHQAASRQSQFTAAGAMINSVLVHSPLERTASFFDRRGKDAVDQTEPIAITINFVLSVDRGDRIFEVHDGRQRRFQNDVCDAGRIGSTDRMVSIDDDFNMQSVILEKNRRRPRGVSTPADESGGARQPYRRVLSHVDNELVAVHEVPKSLRMPADGQRRDLIEPCFGALDHGSSPHRIERGRANRAVVLGYGVGSIKRVVQRSPAGVGRVERITCVRNRHDELRSGDMSNFIVDVRRLDISRRRFGLKVSDLFEKRFVGGLVGYGPGVAPVPFVDHRLKTIALAQKSSIFRRQIVQKFREAHPEGSRCILIARKELILHEFMQYGRDFQAIDFDAIYRSTPIKAEHGRRRSGIPRPGPTTTASVSHMS